MKLSPELEGRVSMVKGFKGTEENLASARAIMSALDNKISENYKNARKPAESLEESSRNSLRI